MRGQLVNPRPKVIACHLIIKVNTPSCSFLGPTYARLYLKFVRMVRALKEGENVPCPAEDLSADDDLLSWILVDQLGCLPGKGLGVHPQQVKFVGTPFKTSEVLKIVSEVSPLFGYVGLAEP